MDGIHSTNQHDVQTVDALFSVSLEFTNQFQRDLHAFFLRIPG